MRKAFLAICITIITMTSCERDDICIDDITPNFTIRFFDSENPTEFKSISQLDVKLLDLEIDSTLTFIGSDSIGLPIRLDVSTTRYSLTNEFSESEVKTDTITLVYTAEPVFVGRACGFKSIFNDVTYSSTNNWINDLEVVSLTIKDETLAHVKIFH